MVLEALAWNAVEATALAIAVGAASRWIRMGAPLRYALWALVLAKLVLPPVALGPPCLDAARPWAVGIARAWWGEDRPRRKASPVTAIPPAESAGDPTGGAPPPLDPCPPTAEGLADTECDGPAPVLGDEEMAGEASISLPSDPSGETAEAPPDLPAALLAPGSLARAGLIAWLGAALAALCVQVCRALRFRRLASPAGPGRPRRRSPPRPAPWPLASASAGRRRCWSSTRRSLPSCGPSAGRW
jgi:hypothetical protein